MTGGIQLANAIEFGLSFALSLVMIFVIIPWLIPKLRAKGMVGKDLNKPTHPEVAELGGIAVVIAFFAGVSLLLALDGVNDRELLEVSLSTVLGAAFIGLIDDIFELRQRQKAFFPFLLALPLGAALNPTITIPYLGDVNFGSWMLVAAPFAITCAANAGNMLEGFNGLGTGLGIIMTTALVSMAILHDRLDGMFLLVPLLGALVGFLWFNKFPAKIFPGDTLMLFMGATIAAAGMLSSLYIQTTLIFMPLILEFFLKSRGHFRAQNYCSESSNGYLEYHGRIESLTHLVMKSNKRTEQQVVSTIWLLEAVVCLVVVMVDILL
jgi:UDP-N-acetylglucosamine--dolichyl-phosphate N-acetylglucosaminephosphotransferase